MGLGPGRGGLSRGERAGAVAIGFAAVLGTLVDPRLAAVPLTLFVLACLAAPFLPAVGFFMPVVTRRASARGVALTFDDGPDPATTLRLLSLLNRYRVHATFFVTGQRAEAYPDLVRAIGRQGHGVGNHSFSHDMLLMLRGRRHLAREIDRTRTVLAGLGIDAPAFRPPVGVVGPNLGPALKRRGMVAVTYSCRALDLGNRRVDRLARRILGQVRAGDIIMLHDVMPPDPANLAVWEAEVARVLTGLGRKGLPVLPLGEIVAI